MSWNLWRDFRYAARRLAANPGFTAATTLTIALGIGLNAGAFSILNGILFAGLPVPGADELVDIYEVVEGLPGRNEKGRVNRQFTTSEYRELSERTETLSGVVGYSINWPVLLRRDGSRQITGRYVTCNYFDVFRQPAALGRGLSSADCEQGAQPVVMLSHHLWTTVFGSDPSIVGRSITLNAASMTVVGIANESAYQPNFQKLDFFTPITTQPLLRPDRQWLASEEFGWLTLVGRRAPGRGTDEVSAELNVIAAQIDRGQQVRSTRVFVDPARPPTNQPRDNSGYATAILFVFVPCGLILLIACVNIANLFLARGTARAPEVALRVSLGASRARVLQQFLAESLLVSLVAGVLGLILFVWTFDALATFALSALPVALPPLHLDFRVLLFALALSLGTGVTTGLVPALGAGNANLFTVTGRSSSHSGTLSGNRLQGAFIGAQSAICMTLLVVTALLLRFLYDANTIDPGFPEDEITVVSGDLRDFGHVGDDLQALQRRLSDEVRAIPGVEAVGFIANPPWDGRSSYSYIGARAEGETGTRQFAVTFVSPDYMEVLGIPIVRGRAFIEEDFADSDIAVVVSETTASQLWPGQDPVGRTIAPSPRAGEVPDREQSWRVVGVAKDTHTAFGEFPEHQVFATSEPELPHTLSLIVRSPRTFASLSADIRSVITRLDPSLSMSVAPLEENLRDYRTVSALTSGVAAALGALALALASVGMYGVVAYVVGRQKREIGIRLALGAPARHVLAAILSRTMRPVAIGAVLGCGGAAIAAVIIQNANTGVTLSDPLAAIGGIVIVLGVSLFASVMPARRGLRIDPMATLRSD